MSILAIPNLFDLEGRVESRRVLLPTEASPRMEISFSGVVQSTRLGQGSAACTFVAQPGAGGVYSWRGRGVLFVDEGSASTESWGRGRREGGALIYSGCMLFKSYGPSLGWLDALCVGFEYRQDMQSLTVTLACHEAGFSKTGIAVHGEPN
jgi:hypothetical protein